jgi:hypothetical protein
VGLSYRGRAAKRGGARAPGQCWVVDRGRVKQRPNLPNLAAPSSQTQLYFAIIGAAGFHRLLQHKDNTLFATSLYKIDRIIKEKQGAQLEETAEQLVDRKLPLRYAAYRNVFSKTTLDQLPLHRSYNYKI